MLESHLEGLSFDDPAAFLVLADWLQSQQDPWGELIALQSANKPELAPRIAELLDSHGPALVGTARCEWQYGFAKTATLVPAEPTQAGLIAALHDFFARPAARLCDGLVFAPLPDHLHTTRDSDSSSGEVIDPFRNCEDLLKLVPERITRLGFGPWPAPPIAAYVYMPEFREVSGWFQRITELTLVGQDRALKSRFLLPNCKRLVLRCADIHTETIESLLASELPALESLTISGGGAANCILDDVHPPEDYDDDNPDAERYPDTYTADDLASLEIHGVRGMITVELSRLGDAKNLPTLRHLSLASSLVDGGCLAQLAYSPLLAQLTSLDLSDGRLRDEDVRDLIARKDQYAHLESLDLRRNQLTGKTCERIKAVLPNANVGEQQRTGQPAFFMRYVATME